MSKTGSSEKLEKVEYEGLKFEWLGYATVRIESDTGKIVYIDPGRYDVLGDAEPKDGDVVFISHNHHYDRDAIHRVTSGDAVVFSHKELDTAVLDREVRELGLGDEFSFDRIDGKTVPAYNLREGKHVKEDGSPHHQKGDVVGFVLDIDGVTIYFPSDSDPLEENSEIDVDVFIPPIGGTYTMDRHEAAEFAEVLDPELVLPIHYDTFEAIEADEYAFKRDVESRGLDVVLLSS